ncbi:phosphotransferase enzyme family protein [Gluconacetobacter tumulisoli]|uniref:Phosphotransferase n=1 Tax=Gluconacetobacter tumulisoli TaxID=1286189 RepID=A0A7W4K9I2_9PROT|nr:phosphotransferase [Gluconacetobacter tumulisoli]MBB2202772.1 phosphotransferase [Gluconacetobacter tumulisoli]
MNVRHADPLDNAALSRLAGHAMARYPAPFQGELRLLTRSENATFRIDAHGRRYALRIHRPDYHQKADIEGELAWLDALHRDIGLVVPTAIPDRSGTRVLTLDAPDGSHRHAVLFHWIDGEMPTSNLDPASFQQLGEITARLHQHSRNWKRPAGFHRIIWDHETMTGPDGHWGDWHDTPGLGANDIATIEAAMQDAGRKLAAFGKSEDRYGLIHADLRLTNLLLHHGETRVIDFDDCGMGWFMHDLPAAISFEEHHPSAPVWVSNWLDGYERIAAVTDEERAILPALFIQRRVQMTAWVGSHAETEMAQSLGPDWVGHTPRLCRLYLDGPGLPIGAG